MKKKIFLSSDHGGFELKTSVINFLKEGNYDVEDLGCFSLESVDYPDYANLMAKNIKNNINSFGILFCGTGIGVSIAANRHSHIRAALCTSVEMASKSRKHNDANVLALGGRILNNLIIKDIVFQFLNTDFEEGRHRLRVNKL
ncbi:ribose 5-phosphate isomerase B [Alphaproteobacteria bacterium]|nr:ribose 5-phosphate isomerase B [Alphaproteobacteria bacterium]|tara:strand:- start:547 stop:975 length:429 start_codon:yes stop_codon:yes gene_type:complete